MKIGQFLPQLLLLGFLLGIHDGHIALWKGEDPEPVRIFPYSASMLPEQDQALLKQGIPIRSREELSKILEDFCS